MYCKYCNRLLPDDMFYFRKDTKRREKMCLDCKSMYQKEYQIKNKDRINQKRREERKKEKVIEDKIYKNKINQTIGGCKCYIQNHAKTGEYHFNIVTTDGEVLKTNSFDDFLSFINKYKNLG